MVESVLDRRQSGEGGGGIDVGSVWERSGLDVSGGRMELDRTRRAQRQRWTRQMGSTVRLVHGHREADRRKCGRGLNRGRNWCGYEKQKQEEEGDQKQKQTARPS